VTSWRAVNDVGQASFQTPHGLHRRLARSELAVVVRPTFGVVADLHNRGDVQDVVHPPVPGAGEPVTVLLPG
jgi:hypothetical protein